MGSAPISASPSRQLALRATGLPAGSQVRLVQGVVDYAGPAHPDPVNTYTPIHRTDLAAGELAVTVPNRISSYVRLEVLAADGSYVALSNPIWLLRELPPTGIPGARQH